MSNYILRPFLAILRAPLFSPIRIYSVTRHAIENYGDEAVLNVWDRIDRGKFKPETQWELSNTYIYELEDLISQDYESDDDPEAVRIWHDLVLTVNPNYRGEHTDELFDLPVQDELTPVEHRLGNFDPESRKANPDHASFLVARHKDDDAW